MSEGVEPLVLRARLTAPPGPGIGAQMAMVGLLAVPALGLSLFLALKGLWPVTPFLGGDVLLVAAAFWVVRRRRRAAYEDVLVGADSILIRRCDGRRRVVEETLPTIWTRLERDEDEDFGCLALRLRRRRRAVAVADLLSPADRRSFAELLGEALHRARRGGLAALQPVAVPDRFAATGGGR
jgi:uncharacterized membrane protein